MKDLSIYIHIPFCKEKCFYCDFLSFTNKEDEYNLYLNALLREIEQFAINNSNKYIIKSIFIGGGTPSILPIGHIEQIMSFIFKNFNIENNAEITIEVNPGVISQELIKSFKKSYINRVSFGFQAWQNNILKQLGRVHNREQFVDNFYNFRNLGFNNINVDLMFSLPNQSLENWTETLNEVCKLKPEHISCYSLIIEEDTVFYKLYQQNKLDILSEELDRKMYYTAINILQKNGYNQYEISNFALQDKTCYHNIVYWRRKEYVGFGLGASSLLNETRITNTRNLNDYINYKNERSIESLQLNDIYSEFVFLGLRMNSGISKTIFYNNFGISIYEVYGKQIKKFVNQLLLEDKDDFIKLTNKGRDVSNLIFVEFL